MGIIKQLSSLEVQKIAAGQVVERPANIVKELVENSIDAGAKNIKIYVEAGGQSLIRIVDNGRGMEEDDARACFENHATSKIETVNDLTHLTTFGFRGEALASIAAVSKVELLTRIARNSVGTSISLSPGLPENATKISMPIGTEITIRDIFFNIPARRKFLKKEESEWRAMLHLFHAFCLSHLDIHFQIFADNKSAYNCPPVKSLKNRMVQLLDDQTVSQLFVTEPREEHQTLTSGVISGPHLSRYNKNSFFFLINRRSIKNYQLMNAVMKGYNNVLPTGRYPVGVITIEIDPSLIDVNVDPRKEEIRFAHPRRVEQLISNTVRTTLEKQVTGISFASAQQEQKTNTTSFMFPQEPYLEPVSLSFAPWPTASFHQKTSDEIDQKMTIAPTFQTLPSPPPIQQQKIIDQEEISWRLVGVIHNTYIIVQRAEELVIIDQHAAHERILFEQYSQHHESLDTIPLLFPIIVSIGQTQKELVVLIQPILHHYGVDIDLLTDHEIIVRSVPANLQHLCFKEFIGQLLAMAQEEDQLNHQECKERLSKKLVATMACKAAVKAGDSLTSEQLNNLVKNLHSTANSFSCPHGRPTTWAISLGELEKKFRRKT